MRTVLFASLSVLLSLSLVVGCGEKKGDPAGTAPTSQPAAEKTAPEAPSSQTQPPAETEPRPKSEEVDLVIAAAKADARAKNPGLGELEVLALRIANDWAIVEMQPADRSTDRASWLLRRIDEKWNVLAYGTAINPSDHPDAPPELFK